MTRLALEHNAVNHGARASPTFPASAEVKEAARQAIADDIEISTPSPGARRNCAMPSLENLSARRAFASILSGKLPCAADLPKA